MNIPLLKEALLANCTTKIMALIVGCFLWSFFSLERDIEVSLSVPVCFNECENIVPSSEMIKIKLRAARKDFYDFDASCLAVHIWGADIKNKKSCILVNSERLLLPSSIRLIGSCPTYITLERADTTSV